MFEQWLMDPRVKTQIERVVQEIIDTRGATQAQIKSFFASERLRNRMLAGFDEMVAHDKTPLLRCAAEEAQTD